MLSTVGGMCRDRLNENFARVGVDVFRRSSGLCAGLSISIGFLCWGRVAWPRRIVCMIHGSDGSVDSDECDDCDDCDDS